MGKSKKQDNNKPIPATPDNGHVDGNAMFDQASVDTSISTNGHKKVRQPGLNDLVSIEEEFTPGSLADELLKWKSKLIDSIPRAVISEAERAYATQLFYEELQVSGRKKRGVSSLMAVMSFNLELSTAVGGRARKDVVDVLGTSRTEQDNRSWWQRAIGINRKGIDYGQI